MSYFVAPATIERRIDSTVADATTMCFTEPSDPALKDRAKITTSLRDT